MGEEATALLRRWVSDRLDDAMFPVLKLVNWGYRSRLGGYRPAEPCEVAALTAIRPARQVECRDERTWRGYRVEAFRFESPMECGCLENRTVTGRLITADSTAPWTLVVPGYATGALPPYGYWFYQDLQGHMLLQRGLNVALIDLPFHLKRKRSGWGSGEGFFTPDLKQTQATFLQAAADAIALLRWLQEERSGRPAGLWGTSLGGGIAGLAAGHMAELGALVLMEPLDNPGDTLAVLPGSWEIRERLMAEGVPPERLPELFRPLAPSSYEPALPRERILFVTPLWDRVIPTRFQEAFWEAWGRPERILREAGHVTMAPDRELNAHIADFLTEWIRSPAT